MSRPVYVYALLITYPEGSLADICWEPEDWQPYDEEDAWFHWPQERKFLSRRAAEKRATRLRSYGARVTIVRSQPVCFCAQPHIEPKGQTNTCSRVV